MLGKDYFANRLGDIYEYSRIPYKSGKCVSNEEKNYFWELCVDVSGNIIFVLHSNTITDCTFQISQIQYISGMCDDEVWKIISKDIVIQKITTFFQENSVLITYFCIPSSILLKLKCKTPIIFSLVRGYFSNFSFSNRSFAAKADNKEIQFKMLQTSKNIIELLEIKRIDNALLSIIEVPVKEGEDIDNVKAEITSISFFVSLLSANLNFVPIIEYISEDIVSQILIENTNKQSFHTKGIIDNIQISQGIPNAFNEIYQNYKAYQNEICIDIIIIFIAEINQTKHINLKLATMLMAYEYPLLKYLMSKGLARDKIGDNIQKKLNQVNSYLRFIPSEMTKDTLRESIRNPLFHQGEIPDFDIYDKIDIFNKYYDLLMRIILKVLGYTGKYVSLLTHEPTDT
ncbi:hypothetical protein CDG76_12215 [Nostoc sp. 'Peltigera membranacea cyanobiont' 210A]|uniref:hypothetical protein n=1 Tax=Nostoc sp. 'Peltigera membranacea cyanobiont' 210A TaxID=2014529 RepID=UPI000B950C85|nr:hypothetical protein [Nostoc sp. 'Peltigera membranacea cyanobiont' 210A]OYD95695.1 hypothetical protein CDG76_12215 [Nostoc sp. 'Peltigera membranacea cyanobiont' 210A]